MNIFCDTNIVLEFLEKRKCSEYVRQNMGCDVFLTINERHFTKFATTSTMELLTPIEYIAKYMKEV